MRGQTYGYSHRSEDLWKWMLLSKNIGTKIISSARFAIKIASKVKKSEAFRNSFCHKIGVWRGCHKTFMIHLACAGKGKSILMEITLKIVQIEQLLIQITCKFLLNLAILDEISAFLKCF